MSITKLTEKVDKLTAKLKKVKLKLLRKTQEQCTHNSWSGNGVHSQCNSCGKVKITNYTY